MEIINTKGPYRFGIRLTASDFRPSKPAEEPKSAPVEEVVPVEPEKEPVIEEPVAETPVEEPEIVAQEEVQAEPEQETAPEPETVAEEPAGTPLRDAGFSARSARLLKVSNITTVEELQEYLATGKTIEDLPEIGPKIAKVIAEELENYTK